MTTKVCSRCQLEKPLDSFSKDKKRKDGKNPHCRDCCGQYYRDNREERLSKNKARHAANPMSARERASKWQRENRDQKNSNNRRWLNNNKEAMKETRKRWHDANPDKVDAINARRRCKKMMATPSWADKEAILAIYTEAERLSRETGIKHNVDHIIPLQSKHVCGLHVEFNLRAIPEYENFRKGNKFTPGYQE